MDRLFQAKLANATAGGKYKGALVTTLTIKDTPFPDIKNRRAAKDFLDYILGALGRPDLTGSVEWEVENGQDYLKTNGDCWVVYAISGSNVPSRW